MKNVAPVLFIASDDTRSGSATGQIMARLAEAVRGFGYETLLASSADDGLAFVESRPIFGAIVIDWSLRGGPEFPVGAAAEIVRSVRKRSPQLPIFIALGRTRISELPWDVVHEVREYVHLLNETTDSTATRIDFAVRQYLNILLPRYFRTLLQEAEEGANLWDGPGHQGGEGFRRHPIGMALRRVLGEGMLRADLGVRLPAFRNWMGSNTALAGAERRAAKVFGAQWSLYGVSGAGASNRAVVSGLVAHDEVVLVDRNADRSLCDAFALAGARPAYLMPTCNGYGMAGLTSLRQLTADRLREALERSPLACGRSGPILATIKNSSHDGLCYDVERVVRLIGSVVPRLHFDESAYGHAHFHPLYHGRHAMSLPTFDPARPTVLATHSGSTMLAALSMATMIHAQPSPRAPIDFKSFHRAFAMHNPDTPFLPILASLDVVTAMMAPPAGRRMVEDTMIDAITFRQIVAATKRHFAEEFDVEEWFFDVYQPDHVNDATTRETYPFPDAPLNCLLGDASCWRLNPDDRWHGFESDAVDGGFCMLDPLKVTLLCPGIDARGRMQPRGIPASIVARFLAERRTFVARWGDYTMLLLFSIGAGEQKWGTLLRALHAFKRHYDEGATVDEVMPDFAATEPQYARMTLRALCDAVHAKICELGLSRLAREAVAAVPEPVLTPFAAHQLHIRDSATSIPLAQFGNRIASAMVVPRPPGVPLLMPGERMGSADSPAMRFLGALEAFAKAFPCFQHEISGIERDEQNNFYVRALAEPVAARPIQKLEKLMERRPTRSRKRARA